MARTHASQKDNLVSWAEDPSGSLPATPVVRFLSGDCRHKKHLFPVNRMSLSVVKHEPYWATKFRQWRVKKGGGKPMFQWKIYSGQQTFLGPPGRVRPLAQVVAGFEGRDGITPFFSEPTPGTSFLLFICIYFFERQSCVCVHPPQLALCP